MAVMAQALHVVICVAAPLCQAEDVVEFSGRAYASVDQAHHAQGIGAQEFVTQALQRASCDARIDVQG